MKLRKPCRCSRCCRSRRAWFISKSCRRAQQVGYNGTWTAPCDTRVVTLPVGYGDGYRRSLSNRGRVLIRGNSYPIVGNVSMDQITVNIGDGTAYNDDEVVLIGAQGDECIPLRNGKLDGDDSL
jgi:alanine racemase